jgi:hypothetical protein
MEYLLDQDHRAGQPVYGEDVQPEGKLPSLKSNSVTLVSLGMYSTSNSIRVPLQVVDEVAAVN